MRLRTEQKLFLSYMAVITAGVLALTSGVRTTVRQHLTETVAADLRQEIGLARSLAVTRPDLSPDSLAHWLGTVSGRRVTLVARDGMVLGDSELRPDQRVRMENHGSRPEIRAALRGRVGEDVRVSRTLGFEHLYVAAPGPPGAVIRLAIPLVQVNVALRRLEAGIFSVGLAALLLTAILSLGFSVAITNRLRHLVRAARTMAGGDLTLRVHSPSDDELGELAAALDALAEELQGRLAELEGERAETQALIDAMSEGVLGISRAGTIDRANPAARSIFSLPALGRGLAPEAVHRGKTFLHLVQQAREGRVLTPTELTVGNRELLASAQPLPDGGAVMVFRDVSELRRLEGIRRDFVANASHELKTPLTAIRGYVETLMDEELPTELRAQFLKTVKANAERLQRIVDDLLDLSRIESGGYRVEPEPVPLRELVAEAWEQCGDAAREKGARLEVEIDPESDLVLADPSAMRQVLANLFSNSIRHLTDGGVVRVTATAAAGPSFVPAAAEVASGRRRWIRVSVHDTGAGIPAAHLPRIFERFYRADAARARADGGTGLGLAIVKHLIEQHGGTVQAESRLGEGTTIRFTLPAVEGVELCDHAA